MEEGASSPGDGGGMQFQVAVAVRGDGRASRRAARWAAASLVPPGGRVALVHVIPPVSFVPSPCKDHFTSLPLLESSGFQMGAKPPDDGLHGFSFSVWRSRGEGAGAQDGAGGGGDVRAGQPRARAGDLPPLPPPRRPRQKREWQWPPSRFTPRRSFAGTASFLIDWFEPAKFAGGDGGSGRGQRRGGAAEVRGGVRRPQPRARIRLPQLVPEVRIFSTQGGWNFTFEKGTYPVLIELLCSY
jgi:hypothetical protein